MRPTLNQPLADARLSKKFSRFGVITTKVKNKARVLVGAEIFLVDPKVFSILG